MPSASPFAPPAAPARDRPLRILYVSQYFPPEIGAPAARVHELSRAWARLGHEVTVLTAFAHHPTGRKAPADRFVLTRRERVDGIDLVRTYVYAAANKGVVRRMLSYASFALSAITIGTLRVRGRGRGRRPDVVVATSPQLLCGAAGYAVSRLLGAPFVFEVRDLWPESVLAVEAMRSGTVVRGLKALASFLYRHARRIVTVGDGYRRAIHELYAIPLEKMDAVPNGVDLDLFRPAPRDNLVRAEHGWGDRFVVLYLGTHGMAHALDRVLDAAAVLRTDPRLLFAFVGEGAEKERLKAKAASLALANVQFIDAQPKARVPLYYAACDLGLVTLRDAALFRDVLPSKIFEYLAMERPLLIGVDGDARRVVEAAGAGEFVPPEDVSGMVKAIRRLAEAPAQLEEMGRRGRRYVLEHHDRAALAARYVEILRAVARPG